MKIGRLVLALIWAGIASLSGCALVPSPPLADTAERENQFHLLATDESTCGPKLAQIKLAWLSGREWPRSQTATDLKRIWPDCPAAAEYYWQNRTEMLSAIKYATGNDTRNLDAGALRSLISHGHFEYLSHYWRGVNQQAAPYWFSVSYIVPAMMYAAEHVHGREAIFADQALVEYWQTGCDTNTLATTTPTILSPVTRSCKVRKDLSGQFFGNLVVETGQSADVPFRLATSIADQYLQRRAFGEALGWYNVAINSVSDEMRRQWAQEDRGIQVFMRLYRPGQNIDEVLRAAMPIGATSLQSDMASIRERIEIIRDAGVHEVPPFSAS